ncbi:hypothetical protein Dimus_022811, partial [Dionaea muscipula]
PRGLKGSSSAVALSGSGDEDGGEEKSSSHDHHTSPSEQAPHRRTRIGFGVTGADDGGSSEREQRRRRRCREEKFLIWNLTGCVARLGGARRCSCEVLVTRCGCEEIEPGRAGAVVGGRRCVSSRADGGGKAKRPTPRSGRER